MKPNFVSLLVVILFSLHCSSALTARPPNVILIMADDVSWEAFGCYGAEDYKTPNIDALAARGVRYDRAYVQSPVCGASRMSTYTGRYVQSHGAAFNGWPLRVGEYTMGDHLRANDMGCWLVGKTHMAADADGMARLGLEPDSIIGVRQAECGFDVWKRDDGLWAEGPDGFYDERRSPYNEYLKSKGYPGENPWADFANAGVDGNKVASGWFMQHADKAANIAEEDSETPWLTTEAIRFMEQATDPWCAHISYIKPHWPYIVPAPYHNMYGQEHIQTPVRTDEERTNGHPVYKAFQANVVGTAFSRDEVRKTVIPAYMGLIKQCDDQLGRLVDWLEETVRDKDTVIVLTSDHGDYLGDHWLGEKGMLHDPSVRVPLIVYDPSERADASRGTVSNAMVEQIDLTATFIEMAGGEVPTHIVEGRSLLPLLAGETPDNWRDYAISEYDYSATPMRKALGLEIKDARLMMVCDQRWKMIHAEGGFRPMLFDRDIDPGEVNDLGDDPDYADVVARLYDALHAWARRQSQRVTMSDYKIENGMSRSRRRGITLGVFDENDIDPELMSAYSRDIPKA